MLNTKLLGSVSAGPAEYVDDVFSTFLYTGTGAPQTINNGIDLAGEGGMVWCKDRSNGFEYHHIFDTVRGATKGLYPNTTDAEADSASYLSSFNNNGFTIAAANGFNTSGRNEVSWTFRKAPKFFDVVTYTGNSATQNISHNLGSVPGMIIVKRTDSTGDWFVYHRSLANTQYLRLNFTNGVATSSVAWDSTTPTSTQFTVGASATNLSGGTYVAYLFAHDAGGFGTAGTDNVISCGSYTGTGAAGNAITLGYEPQYVLIKAASGTSASLQDWYVYDVMRGMPNGSDDARLMPNLSDAEGSFNEICPSATGFICEASGARLNESGSTYIYMAIRRPMKPPTSGTQVFAPITYAGVNTAGQVISGAGFSPDLSIPFSRAGAGGAVSQFIDRLRGGTAYLPPSSTAAEGNTAGFYIRSFDMDGVTYGSAYLDYTNASYNYVNWMFKRATGFFDVVCYTGTGSARTVAHNLGAVPELMIVKSRNSAYEWSVYSSALGNTKFLFLQSTGAAQTGSGWWNNTSPTSSVFTVNTDISVNESAKTYVAYLFATLAGVSKVGSYTGNGSSQTINCGFTAGARFVMVKATSTTGDWVTLDTARGIVSGNDPFLQLNSTAAEVTGEDIVDPDNSGFIVNSTTENINASGGTYIYLAIA